MRNPKNTLLVAFSVLVASFLGLPSALYSAPRPQQESATTSQESFVSPDAAMQALIRASADYDVPTLMKIFGPDGKDFVESADPVHDKNQAEAFAKLAQEKSSVTISSKNPNRASVVVGNEGWPFPVPLVKRNGKWVFDSQAGRSEILYRRIGANELDAIQVCRGYVEAQKEYAESIHDDSGVNQYAQKIISSPGKQDGLSWRNANGTPGGPIGEAVAKAIEEGYSSKAEPYHGYYFKILKGQGPAAPMGQLNYVIEGIMIGGFALVATPADFRVTGVKTFIVSNDGIVYQKDLGPDSLKVFQEMEIYNPDKTWTPTNDQWPVTAWASNSTEGNP